VAGVKGDRAVLDRGIGDGAICADDIEVEVKSRAVEFRDREVVIIGAKRSGLAAAGLLLHNGARVRAIADQPLTPDELAVFAGLRVPVAAQSPENLLGSDPKQEPDVIVLSPAVPADLPLLEEARRRNIPILGEVELASYFLKGPVLGITGTNGKTTTTALTGHILQECGIACQVGGNIGKAVAGMVETSADSQWNVLELSSFQLENISNFRAGIASCLNVTPDHLDRHHTLEAYVQAKARLFETQRDGDQAVLNYEDATCRGFAGRTKGTVSWFSSAQRAPSGVWLENDRLMLNGKPLMPRSKIRLRGMHNVENVMAAALMAHLAGAEPVRIAAAVETFPGVEHRIEFVRSLDGVAYYNDSKATNVDSTQKAIDAFEGGLWIILGGKDKGSDYRPLAAPLARKAKAALLIGAATPIIAAHLDGALPLVNSGTLAAAVAYARQHAVPGDTVLLAPACASFDQFENFEHRGRVFKQLVAELF
jgi:UDP-N-acetylmuramoylalanine--D-glutamate ligase